MNIGVKIRKVNKKRAAICILLTVFLLTQILPMGMLKPQTAYAADKWDDINTSKNFEWIMAFASCVEIYYSDSQYGELKPVFDRKISSLSWSESHKTQPVHVSDIARVGGSNDPGCSKLGPLVSKALWPDKPNTYLLDHLYNQGTDGSYYLGAPYIVVQEGDTPDTPNLTAIKNEIINLAGAKGYSLDSPIPNMYRRYALNTLFNKCFHRATSGSIFTIPPIATHAGSVAHSYNYKDGTVKDDRVNVGMIVDNTVGDAKDGVWSCEEFASFIKANPDWFAYVDKTEGEIKSLVNEQDAADERARKISEIKSKLIGGKSSVATCISSSDAPDAFKNLDALGQINSITTALMGGEHATISYSSASTTLNPDEIPSFDDIPAPGSSGTLTEATTKAILACIVDKIPTIQTIIDRKIESDYNPNDTGAGTVREDSCESNGGALSWILCSVIDLISGAFNWVDTQIQALLGVDREKYTDDGMYAVWSNFRNIAYGVLIIVMLVMVIGTALGTQLFDAYTVKKALPRMVIAVIFMSLSWYAMIALIDLANIVGNGIMGIMTSPFRCGANATTDCIPTGATFASLFTTSTAAGTTGAIIGIGALMFALPGAGGVILGYVGSALLVITLAFLVLVLRQMFILVLMLLAPVAILAWIFPGNDKMWKLWWSSFSKLLIMFPLIMALIASGRIMSQVIAISSDGLTSWIVKISAYILPYAFIPFTFKFAGGALASISGMVNDRGKGAFDRLKKSRQKNYHKMGGNVLQRRANMAGWAQSKGSVERTGLRGNLANRALRTGGRVLGAGNVEAAMSARNAEEAKIINEQIATGRDDAIRGLTVNKHAADDAAMSATARSDGHRYSAGDLKRITSDGQVQYKTLGGAWVNEASVIEGHQRWGKNQFAQQAALSYEMRKASTEEEVAGISARYDTLATGEGGWGLSRRQADGNFIGAGFENQNQHLEFKHTRFNADTGQMELNAEGLAKEVFEKKGAYPLSQMSAHTIDQLTRSYGDPGTSADTRKHIEAIAEMFVQRGGVADGARDADGVPVATGVATGTAAAPRAYASGSASVNQAVNHLIKETTGGAAPTDPYHPSQGSSPQSEL